MPCQDCGYEMRFNFNAKARVRSCSEISLYFRQNKTLTVVFAIICLLFIGSIIAILLINFEVIPITNEKLERWIIIIALAVFGGIVMVVLFFCCFDMIKTEDITVLELFKRQSRSHRSSRSRRSKGSRASNRSRSPCQSPHTKSIVIEALE